MDEIYSVLNWNKFVKDAHPALREWFRKEVGFIERLSGSVLDVGCGTGRALKVLSKKCDRVVGVDKEKAMVDIAKENTKAMPNVEVYWQDAKKLEFSGNTFDSVICLANTFGNLEKNKAPVLKEMKRVCKKSGRVILSVYNEHSLVPRLESYGKDNLVHIKVSKQGTVYSKQGLVSEQFTKKKLMNLFDEEGLSCEITEFSPVSYLCLCKK